MQTGTKGLKLTHLFATPKNIKNSVNYTNITKNIHHIYFKYTIKGFSKELIFP